MGNRPSERPKPSDRRDNINDRLNNRGDRVDDRMANRDDRYRDRQDRWDDWHDNHYHHHDHWHHGHWHGGIGSGYWWDNYPVLTAFGVTRWAVNRAGWAFGYYPYSNPYASGTTYVDNSVYDYSEPLVMTPDETTLAGDPNDTSAPPEASPEALAAFDQAREEFFAGDYEAALKSTDAALKELPNDAVIHEFRALVAFALKQYQDSAATLYAVLGVGPGWDWTTMSGLYPDVETYTQQLRALEDYRDENPNDPAARFVLAYHYVTGGHDKESEEQLKRLLSITPGDQLAAQLLLDLDPEADVPNPPKQVEPPKPSSKVSEGDLEGNWTASRGESGFGMDLKGDDTFSWKYTESGKTQEVTGVWGVDEDGILALEMNDEGVMLAQVIPSGNKLDFYMLGDSQGAEPLKFVKN